MKAKRQQTDWLFLAKYAHDGLIRVGYIHNKSSGCREDVIRLQIATSKAPPFDISMRLDEAAVVASGLAKVLAYMGLGVKKTPAKTLKVMRGAKT